jgi:hypothetical protein
MKKPGGWQANPGGEFTVDSTTTSTPESRLERRANRTEARKALKLLRAAHSIESVGPTSAFIFLALGERCDVVGPDEHRLFREARRWVRRHKGYRREDAPIVAKIARRADR